MQNDPLWTLRHALAGVAIALALSVPIAALVGAVLGDWLGHSYGWRAALYGLLLVYVVAGTAVLFVKVARHEKRPLSVKRVGLWLASLWLWPALLLFAARPQAGVAEPRTPAQQQEQPATMTPASTPGSPPAVSAAPAQEGAAPPQGPAPPPSL
ncbi:MAG: hypothetical protein U1F67_25775 [Rubrivivax sp.]